MSVSLLLSCTSDNLSVPDDPNSAAILRFEGKPAIISLGESTVLSWQTEGTRSVIIEPELGLQAAEGTYTVRPLASTTYTLRIDTINGPITSEIKIEVTGQAPRINSFVATPKSVVVGESSTLQWTTSNTTRVVITPDIGESPTSGSVIISPMATTTYTLVAMSDTDMITQELTVTVNDQTTPIVRSFTVSPLTVVPGQKATLSWQTSNATSVSIDNNVGTQLPTTGTIEVTPMQTTTYTLTAVNMNQSSSAQVTLTVQANGPLIVSLSAQPASITPGDSSTISWETTGATEVNFDQGIGRKATSGSVIVSPTQSTTYTMRATGSGGETTRTVEVEVVPMGVPSIDGFTVTPNPLNAGDTATLSWRTRNADTVSIDQGLGSQATTGQVSVTPSVNTTYTLQAQNTVGSVSAMVTLNVNTMMTGETCADALVISSSGGNYQGTTVGMSNDYEPPRMCTGYNQLGPDMVYRAALTEGHIMIAVADFEMNLDGAIYTVTDCSDLNNSCVAGSDSGLSGRSESIRHVARQTSDHFVVIDAALSSFSGTHDLSVSFYSAETCSSAAPLRTDGTAEWYTTDGYSDDINLTSSACTGYRSNAAERVYEVQLQAGDQLQASVAPNPVYDPSLYLISDCTAVDMSCIAGSDKPRGDTETINPVVQTAGTYFLVVDSFLQNGIGSGEITAQIAKGDTCNDAYLVNKGNSQFRGTTNSYSADYGTTSANGSCTNWSQAGPDAVYRIELENNETVSATLDSTVMGTPWDAALYLITDCAQSATTCVEGQDSGNPEVITYQNTSGQAQTYYLIVDSFLSTRSGDYTLDITIN